MAGPWSAARVRSSPARRSAVEPSAFLPNTGVAGFAGFYLPGLSPHARSDGAAAFGDRKISFVRKVCENDKNFWKNFVFFAKIGNNRPNFSKTWGMAGSASDSPLLERSFCSWFKLEHGDCPLSASIARPRR